MLRQYQPAVTSSFNILSPLHTVTFSRQVICIRDPPAQQMRLMLDPRNSKARTTTRNHRQPDTMTLDIYLSVPAATTSVLTSLSDLGHPHNHILQLKLMSPMQTVFPRTRTQTARSCYLRPAQLRPPQMRLHLYRSHQHLPRHLKSQQTAYAPSSASGQEPRQAHSMTGGSSNPSRSSPLLPERDQRPQ